MKLLIPLLLIFIIALQSSVMGFTQALIYSGKKWRAFPWDEHLIYNIERGLWWVWAYVFAFIGYKLPFIDSFHFGIFMICVLISMMLQYSFWQNGVYNVVINKTGVYPYTWTSTNDPNNGVWNVSFPQRLLFLFVGASMLFPLYHYTTIN